MQADDYYYMTDAGGLSLPAREKSPGLSNRFNPDVADADGDNGKEEDTTAYEYSSVGLADDINATSQYNMSCSGDLCIRFVKQYIFPCRLSKFDD